MGNEHNVSNIDAEIEDLNKKKALLLCSLKKDMDTLSERISIEYRKLGEKTFELYSEDVELPEILKDILTEIIKYKNEVEAYTKKMSEISARYDDEISILRKLQPDKTIKAPFVTPESSFTPAHNTSAFCSNCGKPYVTSVDVFCIECGAKL